VDPVELPIGESVSVCVDATVKWNWTGVLVAPGQQYRLVAMGSWNDGGVDTDPDGFTPEQAPKISRGLLRAFAGKLRLKNDRYFSLVGGVARANASLFTIGAKLEPWHPTDSGHLECFANDVPFAYINNKGSIQLTITRVA
jgi:hypothetical protein